MLRPAWATFLASLCNSITCKANELENLFNTSKDAVNLVVWIYWKDLDFIFFVGDIISWVSLGISGRGHQALGPNCNSQFLTQFLVENRLYNASL